MPHQRICHSNNTFLLPLGLYVRDSLDFVGPWRNITIFGDRYLPWICSA